MDGDFDVNQRSKRGCVPPLLAMARLGGNNAERESAMLEQEVHPLYHTIARCSCQSCGVLHICLPIVRGVASNCNLTLEEASASAGSASLQKKTASCNALRPLMTR